jgi:uncharacterized membrane protein
MLSMKLKVGKKDVDEEAAGRSASEIIPFDEGGRYLLPETSPNRILPKASTDRILPTTSRGCLLLARGGGDEGSLQSKLKIIVAMYQIVTSFPWTLRLNFPPVYSWFLSILSFFNLELVSMIPVGCMFATNFLMSLLITTVSPILVSIAIYLFAIIWNESIRKAEYKKHTPTIEVNKMIKTSNDMFFQLFLRGLSLCFRGMAPTIHHMCVHL